MADTIAAQENHASLDAALAAQSAPEHRVGDRGAGAGPLSAGRLMGIPLKPETQQEHRIRLGASAGTVTDAGWVTGTDVAGGVAVAVPTGPAPAPEPVAQAKTATKP
jgi:fermentation-respiration switch protein FrsA (DUF1100 family)